MIGAFMAICGLLFDKDGTLLNFHETWMPAIKEVAKYAAGSDAGLTNQLLELGGYDIASGRVRAGSIIAAGTSMELAECYVDYLGPRAPIDLADRVEALFCAHGSANAVLVEGVHEALARLKGASIALGVATNDSVAGLQASLVPHDLTVPFSFLAGHDSGFGAKPGPGMVLAFCETAGLVPSEVGVVGDNMHDLEMARNAGAKLKIGVLTGTSMVTELEPLADHVIESVADLPELLGI